MARALDSLYDTELPKLVDSGIDSLDDACDLVPRI